jgi:hypothetical protein
VALATGLAYGTLIPVATGRGAWTARKQAENRGRALSLDRRAAR